MDGRIDTVSQNGLTLSVEQTKSQIMNICLVGGEIKMKQGLMDMEETKSQNIGDVNGVEELLC